MPWWGWALLAAAAIIVVPIKMRILRQMLSKNDEPDDPEE